MRDYIVVHSQDMHHMYASRMRIIATHLVYQMLVWWIKTLPVSNIYQIPAPEPIELQQVCSQQLLLDRPLLLPLVSGH